MASFIPVAAVLVALLSLLLAASHADTAGNRTTSVTTVGLYSSEKKISKYPNCISIELDAMISTDVAVSQFYADAPAPSEKSCYIQIWTGGLHPPFPKLQNVSETMSVDICTQECIYFFLLSLNFTPLKWALQSTSR